MREGPDADGQWPLVIDHERLVFEGVSLPPGLVHVRGRCGCSKYRCGGPPDAPRLRRGGTSQQRERPVPDPGVQRHRARAWGVALAACAIVGCASVPPPAATSEFAVGDSTQAVAERGYRFVPVYQFALDGHQYAFAHANSGDAVHNLVFIDTKLVCASQASDQELTPWYWVDEPDGLSYLASRLRQACGLEATIPAISLFPVASPAEAEPEPPQADGDVQRGVDQAQAGGTFGKDMAEVAKQGAVAAGKTLLGITAVVFAWPVLLAVGVVSAAVDSTADVEGQKMESHAYEFSLPAPAEDVRQTLGTPSVTFRLPTVDTTVLAYSVGTTHALYVGVSDGQAVWIHGPDPWLQMLEKDAEKVK